MNIELRSVVGIGWLLFFAYWWISAIGVKRNIRHRSWRWEIGVRLVVIGVIIALARLPGSRAFFQGKPPASHPIEGGAGLIVCIAGFGLCVWARRHLGRNWGMPMSLKEGHELVTTGPYSYIRHPIYTGMLLALLGSALVTGTIWLAVSAAIGVYCVYSARTEEQLMTREFPEQYEEYKRRTKRFIPFVV